MSIYTGSFFASHITSYSKEAGDTWEVEREHSQDNCPHLDISWTIWQHAQYIKLRKEEGREDLWSDGICVPKSPLCVMEPWIMPLPLAMAEHLPAYGKEGINYLFSSVKSFCFTY